MCCAGSVVVRCTGIPRFASDTATAAATVVFPTPPLPMTMTSPLLGWTEFVDKISQRRDALRQGHRPGRADISFAAMA